MGQINDIDHLLRIKTGADTDGKKARMLLEELK